MSSTVEVRHPNDNVTPRNLGGRIGVFRPGGKYFAGTVHCDVGQQAVAVQRERTVNIATEPAPSRAVAAVDAADGWGRALDAQTV